MANIRMKKEDAEKWLAALRSGKYKQCAEILHDGTGYCCLGVLEKVVGGEIELVRDGSTFRGLPSCEWLQNNGIMFNDHSYAQSPTLGDTSASSANDAGVTFPEIADLIEQNLETYE